MTTALVRHETHGSVLVATMDDGKANALSLDMIAALHGALDEAEKGASALVIAGRPGRFCAGFDLAAMMAGAESVKTLVGAGAELYLRVLLSPKPVVVAATGHAMAGGAIFLLAADVRVGTAGPFKVGLNEVSLSMTLPIFAMELARDRLAPRELTRATTQAVIYDPEGAVAAGYLDTLAAPEALLETALREANRLGALPGKAFHATKLRERQATADRIRGTVAADLAALTALPG